MQKNRTRGRGVSSSPPKRFEDSNARAKPCVNGSASSVRQEANCSKYAGLTLEGYAEAKRIPLEILQSYGVSQISLLGCLALHIPYLDSAGIEVAVHFRIAMDGPGHFRWRSGTKPCLYGLDRLSAAKDRGHVLLVEGESDCHTCWACDIPALGVPRADTWKEAWGDHLEGIPLIYVVIQPDPGGERVKEWLSKSRIRDRCQILTLGPHKDPSALYLASNADPAIFREHLKAAMAGAIPWGDVEREARKATLSQASRECRHLLQDPELIERLREAIILQGYAGDTRPPLLAYVAVTSRLLERPLNLAFVALSAAGKNKAVDVALELMPREAYFVMKAGSARALIYNDEDCEHRTVMVSEADSLPEEGPAASAIRSLAADNSMTYDVVEQDERTGHFITRRISKPGPTGLLTTSTKSLGEQLGTRVLEVSIPDDENQTRKVLHAHARDVETLKRPAVDLTPFHALQTFLQVSPVKHVIIAFSSILAGMVPVKHVRMRRDFKQLLTCIQASALLHQAQRRAVCEDCIEATLEDYAVARDLLSPPFDTYQAQGATPVIRETVQAVEPGEELSAGTLAKRMGLSDSTLSYRLKRAITGGWIRRDEKTKKLSLGDPLPEDQTALPTVEELGRKFFESSNPSREEGDPLPPSYEEPEILGIKR